MPVNIASQFAFSLPAPSSALLQFEVAALADQRIITSANRIAPTEETSRVAAQDDIGERIWLRGEGRIEVQYEASVEVVRDLPDLSTLTASANRDLPGEAVPYLLDSRYCSADNHQGLVAAEFAGTQGGARVKAIRDWIGQNFEYAPGSSDTSTTASDSIAKRQGICRDFAHVLVALARASTIPARYAACYAPGVTPQDFHAIAQVFLADPSGADSAWHLVDPTGMADLSNAAIIGVGRDAADVSFITTFGPMLFEYSNVAVENEA